MKKKLIFLVNDLGFFISHRLKIAEVANNNGYNVVVGYGDLGNANTKILKNKLIKFVNVPFIRSSINPLKEISSIYLIFKFLKRENPDILHLVTIKPYLYGGVISRLIGIKSVVSSVSGLGTLFIKKDFKNKLLLLMIFPIYKLAFNHFNQIAIFQNKDDLNLFVKNKIIKLSKAILIKGSGIDLKNFPVTKEPTGTPIICFAARLLNDKGINEFISAARLIKKKGLKTKFVIAGDLDLKNPSSLTFRDLQKIKEESLVEFLGYRTDIPTLYASSNIICLPSYREGLPKSLIEAAAASRAIITTDVPGCRDAIIPNKTGLLVPVKDYKSLAKAIIFLIENPDLRKSMGKAGRDLAKKEFQIDKVIRIHLNIYSDLFLNV